jgi:hypothetical protein
MLLRPPEFFAAATNVHRDDVPEKRQQRGLYALQAVRKKPSIPLAPTTGS